MGYDPFVSYIFGVTLNMENYKISSAYATKHGVVNHGQDFCSLFYLFLC